MKINQNKINIYIIFYIFSIIILSRNTMISSCVIGFKESLYISVILSIPIVAVFIKKLINKELNLKQAKMIAPFLAFIIVSIILKMDWQLYNISILFYVIMGLILASIIKFEKFKKIYVNIFLGLAVFSLITTYIVKPILFDMNIEQKLIDNGLIITNSSKINFLNLGLGYALFADNYIRNYGIFTEPNFYQFYLMIAVIMILFLKEGKKTKGDWAKLAIFIITIISTFSTAAFVELVLIMIIQVAKLIVRHKKDIKKVGIIVITCLIICMSLWAIKDVRNVVISTYNKLTTNNVSSQSRFGSVQFTLEETISSPIIGNKIAEILQYEKALTNTTFTLSAVYGIVPLIYSIYFSFRFIKSNNKNSVWIQLAVCGVMILSYNSHLYIGVQSFWMILLSTINLMKEGETENENKVALDS